MNDHFEPIRYFIWKLAKNLLKGSYTCELLGLNSELKAKFDIFKLRLQSLVNLREISQPFRDKVYGEIVS